MKTPGYKDLPNDQLVTANFDTHEVRAYKNPTNDIEDDFCFVLNDICEMLGVQQPRKTAAALDEGSIIKITIQTNNGMREVNALTMGGFFELVNRTRVEGAVKFRRFVNHTLLPAIARKGHWSHSPEVLLDYREMVNQILDNMADKLKAKYFALEEQVENRRNDYKGQDLQLAATNLLASDYRVTMHKQDELRAKMLRLFGDLAYCVITEKPRELNPSHYPIRLTAPDPFAAITR